MKVLFLALDVRAHIPTGDAIHTRELFSSLTGMGHEVVLATHLDGKNVFPVPPPSRVIDLDRTELDYSSITKNGWTPDIIYERRLSPKIGASWARKFKIPLFVEINGKIEDERRVVGKKMIGVGLRRMAWRRNLAWASGVVVVAEGLRSYVIDELNVKKELVKVIPNGVNPDRFKPMPEEEARAVLKIKDARPILLFVGSLQPWQGVDSLISAVREGSSKYLLRVIGDGPDMERLKALAKGLEKDIDFVGQVPYDEIATHICAARLCASVKPPLLPGSPLKVKEYMSCGRPVIATKSSGYDFDIIEKHSCGVLVDPEEPKALNASIETLILDKARCEEMGKRGREAVMAQYTWGHTAKMVVELIGMKK